MFGNHKGSRFSSSHHQNTTTTASQAQGGEDAVSAMSSTSSNISQRISKLRLRNAFRNRLMNSTQPPKSSNTSSSNTIPSQLQIPPAKTQTVSSSAGPSTFQRKKNPSTSNNHQNVLPLSPLGEKKLRLLPKIAEYRSKGYLNDEQERDLYSRLQVHNPANPFDTSALIEVEHILEESRSIPQPREIELALPKHNASKDPKLDHKLRSANSSQSNSNQINRNTSNKTSHGFKAKKEKEEAVSHNSHNSTHYAGAIVDEQDDDSVLCPSSTNRSYSQLPFRQRVLFRAEDVQDQISDDVVENWFVEMCFFARLGFLQPPMCLRCLYMEAIEGMEEDLDCLNYCVWRQDANETLHPNRLSDNLILVECQAARKLIEGDQVQNHYWDHIKRQLVLTEK
jgi:hypothetical protein